MNKAIKIALAVLVMSSIALAINATNDYSTTTYNSGTITLTGGHHRISWTAYPYTNITAVEIQLLTTDLAISCRVNASTLYFKTNDGATAAASVKPWRTLQGAVAGISIITLPLSIFDGKYIDIWNPQVAGVNVKIILK